LVLSTTQDPFLLDNLFANYGDVGVNVKTLVDEFAKQKSAMNVNRYVFVRVCLLIYLQIMEMLESTSKHLLMTLQNKNLH
jgi:hypothetical protein